MIRLALFSSMVIFVSQFALAQDAKNPSETFFKTLDQNGDGLLTREELGPEKEALFNRLVTLSDKNEDGKLTREEFLEGVSPKPATAPTQNGRPMGRPDGGDRGQFPAPEQMFERLDRNGDGKLSKEELPEPLRERFAPVFASIENDFLNVEEFKTAFSLMMERGGGDRPRMPNPEEFFARLDQNKDGEITLDEIPDPIRERFKPMFDRLGKTSITRADFAAVNVQMRQSRRPGDGPPEAGRGERPEGERGERMRGRDGDSSQPRGPAFFGLLDQDRDGMLSAGELSSADQLIAKLDRNNDGKLDPPELMGFGRGEGRPEMMRGGPEPNRPDRPRRPEMEAGDRDRAPEGAPGRGLQNSTNQEFVARMFERFDKNSDGQVSKEEAPERMQQNFDRLDADGSGAISREELQSALSRRNRG